MGIISEFIDGYRFVKELCGNWGDKRCRTYLSRTDVNWDRYNEKTQNRYWVCGTSLVGVANNGVIERLLNNHVYDTRVILPETKQASLSRRQLRGFNKVKKGPIQAQVPLAECSYQRIKALFMKYNVTVDEHLRKYDGVMYSNITIYDNDAFISFYDPTGVGDRNITLHFPDRQSEGYRHAEDLFLYMWDPNHYLGTKEGASILFVNSNNEILLLLRDNSNSIEYPNCWDIPGGHVEENESPEQCIIREMKEEIDKDIKFPKLFNTFNMEDRLENTFWARADWNPKEINLKE